MSSIKDVARRAGVAISTVSKALNGYPNVSEETREKVNEAVRELNFTPFQEGGKSGPSDQAEYTDSGGG